MNSHRGLLVDDDASIATLLAELLVEMGYVVCEIEATEADAVAAALRAKPDLMIVDVNLREGSGLAAVDAILHITPIPHIVISGARLPAGPTSMVMLQKPFMVYDLAYAINNAIAVVGISAA